MQQCLRKYLDGYYLFFDDMINLSLFAYKLYLVAPCRKIREIDTVVLDIQCF